MKQIPQAFIQDILARCDLIELIEARVSLRKKGNNYTACCPFHEEKTPSFSVNAAKGLYHCFGCGVGGNAISFLMEFDRLTFVETIELLAQQLGLPIPQEIAQQVNAKPNTDLYGIMEKACQYYQQQLRSHPGAIDYLKKRGLSGQIAKEYHIGYAPSAWDGLLTRFPAADSEHLVTVGLVIKKNNQKYFDRFRERILFPIRDRRGRVIGFGGRILEKGEPKYLNSPETPIFHKGRELYGLYEAYKALRELPCLIVVEGYMDVVALAQHDIRNAVATLGTAITADHIKALFRATTEVIFCFDGDRAGQAAAWRALEVALPLLQDGLQIRFLLLPAAEDPDSLVRKEGAAQFRERSKNALPLADFLFDTFVQQVDMTTLEGKARLTKLMTPLLNQLPNNVLQHMLYERLATLVRMNVGQLQALTQAEKALPQQVIKPVQSTRSPMRHVIALLLQTPALVQNWPAEIVLDDFLLPGAEILKQLVAVLIANPTLSTAALLEYWRHDDKLAKLLTKLAAVEIIIAQKDFAQEFIGTLQHLQRLNLAEQLQRLLAKRQQGVITDIEMQKLQAITGVVR